MGVLLCTLSYFRVCPVSRVCVHSRIRMYACPAPPCPAWPCPGLSCSPVHGNPLLRPARVRLAGPARLGSALRRPALPRLAPPRSALPCSALLCSALRRPRHAPLYPALSRTVLPCLATQCLNFVSSKHEASNGFLGAAFRLVLKMVHKFALDVGTFCGPFVDRFVDHH